MRATGREGQQSGACAHVRFGSSRLCENLHERRTRSIVFSIVFPRWRSSVFLVFRLTKSRRTFYAQSESRGFHTASRTSPFRGKARKVCNRRILSVPARSGGGRLTERTPAVQPRRRERVKVPLSSPSSAASATSGNGPSPTFPQVVCCAIHGVAEREHAYVGTERCYRAADVAAEGQRQRLAKGALAFAD